MKVTDASSLSPLCLQEEEPCRMTSALPFSICVDNAREHCGQLHGSCTSPSVTEESKNSISKCDQTCAALCQPCLDDVLENQTPKRSSNLVTP